MTDETRQAQEERERAVEQELVAKSQRGDRDAFNRLVERHQAGAYGVAWRMLGDPDVAPALGSLAHSLNTVPGSGQHGSPMPTCAKQTSVMFVWTRPHPSSAPA